MGFFDDLLKNIRIVSGDPETNDVVLLSKGCRSDILNNVVVSRAAVDSLVVKYRASNPACEPFLILLGTNQLDRDMQLKLLHIKSFTEMYNKLSADKTAGELESLEQESNTDLNACVDSSNQHDVGESVTDDEAKETSWAANDVEGPDETNDNMEETPSKEKSVDAVGENANSDLDPEGIKSTDDLTECSVKEEVTSNTISDGVIEGDHCSTDIIGNTRSNEMGIPGSTFESNGSELVEGPSPLDAIVTNDNNIEVPGLDVTDGVGVKQDMESASINPVLDFTSNNMEADMDSIFDNGIVSSTHTMNSSMEKSIEVVSDGDAELKSLFGEVLDGMDDAQHDKDIPTLMNDQEVHDFEVITQGSSSGSVDVEDDFEQDMLNGLSEDSPNTDNVQIEESASVVSSTYIEDATSSANGEQSEWQEEPDSDEVDIPETKTPDYSQPEKIEQVMAHLADAISTGNYKFSEDDYIELTYDISDCIAALGATCFTNEDAHDIQVSLNTLSEAYNSHGLIGYANAFNTLMIYEFQLCKDYGRVITDDENATLAAAFDKAISLLEDDR